MLKEHLIKLEKWSGKNSPTILCGFAVVGVISVAALSSYAAIKTKKDLEMAKKENGYVTKSTAAITIAKNYIPSILATGATVVCMVESHKIDIKRQAAIATAYSATKIAYDNFKDRAKEVIGEKKVDKIVETAKVHNVEKTPMKSEPTILFEGNGKTLFFDNYTGRYFRSDVESIRKIMNKLNADLRSDFYVSLNNFYELLQDVSSTPIPTCKSGDALGWNVDSFPIDIDLSTATIAANGEPCIIMDFDTMPVPEFDYYH